MWPFTRTPEREEPGPGPFEHKDYTYLFVKMDPRGWATGDADIDKRLAKRASDALNDRLKKMGNRLTRGEYCPKNEAYQRAKFARDELVRLSKEHHDLHATIVQTLITHAGKPVYELADQIVDAISEGSR